MVYIIRTFALLVGLKWDDAVIEHYGTAIERKENEKN